MIDQFNGKRVLFIGDSITDADRQREDDRSLGGGYVSYIAAMVDALNPAARATFINRGIGGDRVPDLKARWDRDVIAWQPDWVSVSIGINDVWRAFGPTPEVIQQAVPLEVYKATYDELLARVKRETKARLILMETSIINEDAEHPANKMLADYNEAIRGLALRYDAVLVPVYREFMKAITIRPGTPWSEDAWTTDGVHPRPRGHMLMAVTWLRAMKLLQETRP